VTDLCSLVTFGLGQACRIVRRLQCSNKQWIIIVCDRHWVCSSAFHRFECRNASLSRIWTSNNGFKVQSPPSALYRGKWRLCTIHIAIRSFGSPLKYGGTLLFHSLKYQPYQDNGKLQMEAIDKVISFLRPVFPDSELEFICFPIKRKLPLLLCGLFRDFIPFLISPYVFFSLFFFLLFSFFFFFIPFVLLICLCASKRVLFDFKKVSAKLVLWGTGQSLRYINCIVINTLLLAATSQ